MIPGPRPQMADATTEAEKKSSGRCADPAMFSIRKESPVAPTQMAMAWIQGAAFFHGLSFTGHKLFHGPGDGRKFDIYARKPFVNEQASVEAGNI